MVVLIFEPFLFTFPVIQSCTLCNYSKVQVGLVEWIQHPLLILKVQGSNPGHSFSKNTTSLPQSLISELSERGGVKQKNPHELNL